MTEARIAFYAPIKPPDHHIASGDREIARLLVKALENAGYQVEIASRYIAYQKKPDPELFETRKAGGEAEAALLIKQFGKNGAPNLWFTYHPYCKAADWLGPVISEAFGIPYVTAEAARTGQGSGDDWAGGREQVQHAIRHADVNICLKQSDWDYLETVLPMMNGVARLVPFIDADEVRILAAGASSQSLFSNDYPVLVTAGMMRPGWKRESYRQLAEALSLITDLDWNLLVIGDGPMRDEIEAELAFIDPSRIHFTGAVEKEQMPALLSQGDIFVWPGLREAIGMVFLEAQALGLPVAAMRSLGVPSVVKDGESGLLADENDVPDLAGILRSLLTQPPLRRELGEGAAKYVEKEHGIDAASRALKAALDPLLKSS